MRHPVHNAKIISFIAHLFQRHRVGLDGRDRRVSDGDRRRRRGRHLAPFPFDDPRVLKSVSFLTQIFQSVIFLAGTSLFDNKVNFFIVRSLVGQQWQRLQVKQNISGAMQVTSSI